MERWSRRTGGVLAKEESGTGGIGNNKWQSLPGIWDSAGGRSVQLAEPAKVCPILYIYLYCEIP